MGRVFVDREDDGETMEYCYETEFCDIESVTVDITQPTVVIADSSDEYFVYVNDIPKLIKALQAAYTYYEENAE